MFTVFAKIFIMYFVFVAQSCSTIPASSVPARKYDNENTHWQWAEKNSATVSGIKKTNPKIVPQKFEFYSFPKS